jgi:hypothetical protein
MSEQRLEKVLRESLQREEAPPDFAAKILANTSAAPVKLSVVPDRPKSWLQKPVTLALAATLAAMAIIPAVVMDYRRREDEARGLKAKQDLILALAITRDQFRQVKEKVHRTTNTQLRNTQ